MLYLLKVPEHNFTANYTGTTVHLVRTKTKASLKAQRPSKHLSKHAWPCQTTSLTQDKMQKPTLMSAPLTGYKEGATDHKISK